MSSLGNYRSCSNYGVAFYQTIIHNNGAHADKYIVLYGTSVDYGIVSYGNIVSNNKRIFFVGAMEHHIVLYIYFVAHFYIVYIATDNGIVPDATLFSHGYIAYNNGGFSNESLFSNFRGLAQ